MLIPWAIVTFAVAVFSFLFSLAALIDYSDSRNSVEREDNRMAARFFVIIFLLSPLWPVMLLAGVGYGAFAVWKIVGPQGLTKNKD